MSEEIFDEQAHHEEALRMAGAVQVGGELPDQLIVRPGPDGYPLVYAHIMDVELDVITVDFCLDETMHFRTSDFDYLTLHRETLMLILELQEYAREVWEEATDIIDGMEEYGAIPSDDSPDPLAHLYTQNDKIEVPSTLVEAMRGHLHIKTDTPKG